ncbi:MAG: DNA repair protein RadA, partial [Acidobacteriota bacterium]
TVLYVAGEESAQQIKMRGDRLGIKGERLLISPETCLEQVLQEVERLKPDILIVDSIQTVHTEQLPSVPGSIGQIRECALRLLNLSKSRNIPTFLIGHITKDGALAGPKALEHIVDVVLYFEGDRHQNQKLIRTVKNRFGPANELGIFEMTSAGLRCVENPSELFLSERATNVSGSVVLAAIQGSRPVLVELQALVSHSNFSTARRMANGVDPNRVSLLLAMLEKRMGFHLLGSDVYLNAAGGISLAEPAVDLALVGAVVSSFRDLPVPSKTLTFGEVGLAGEVRAVSFATTRIKEALNLGFEQVILPQGNLPISEPMGKIELRGVSTVDQFLDAVGL